MAIGAGTMIGAGNSIAKDSHNNKSNEPHNWYKEINRASNKELPLETVKENIPRIIVPDMILPGAILPVKIAVGETPHVMTPHHYIQYIEMYLDNTLWTRTEFTYFATLAEVSIPIKLNKNATIKAWAYCNLHGLWESTLDIKVES